MNLVLATDTGSDTDPLPATFEAPTYRSLWPDLAALDDKALRLHYEQFGADEGRLANSLVSREEFAGLIPADADALEIGPFCKPLLRGPRTKYFDVMDKPALEQRARGIGLPEAVAPQIDYISAVGDLAVVDMSFDYVLSSHCIEHQPDLIGHLQQVSRILRPNGRYLMLVPDKRFCFDALLAESTIAEVLDAHHSGRKTHSLRSVIEHRVLTTHNDCLRHWQGDHGSLQDKDASRLLASIQEFNAANGGYVDVHAWYFTPRSINSLFGLLGEAGYIDFSVERLYPTRLNSIEFWMVLRKPSKSAVNVGSDKQ